MLIDSDCAIDVETLSRKVMMDLAKAWRHRALRGDRTTHGPAHARDVVNRRWFGSRSAALPMHDLRPLAVLPSSQRRRLGFGSWSSP